jgi:hypothetical protein
MRKVTKEEFDAWVAAYPRTLSPLPNTVMDATGYHDLQGGPYSYQNVVAVRRWGQYGNPDAFLVEDPE